MLLKTVFISIYLGFIGMSMGQLVVPQLSVGSQLEALTPPAAFQSHSSPTNALRSNFPGVTLQKIAQGAQEFGLDFLDRISLAAQKGNRDYMVSPFSVWSLLILLYEGSSGETYQNLRKTLRINVDDKTLRSVYGLWSTNLNVNTSTIEVASLQAVYTDKSVPLESEYRNVLQYYNVQPAIVDFYDRNTPAQINEATNRSTRGLIPYTVLPQDIYGAKLFMLSSLFFKGQWKYPFNESATRLESFYDENGNVINRVQMMAQEANFAFAVNIEGLDGYVLELPYGMQDRLSMIIILPKRGFKLAEIATNLKKLGLTPIMERIAKFRREVPEDNEVEVLMPKFVTTTDMVLKDLLSSMGLRDLFDENRADLSRMANGLYANLCVHSTKIIVDEKGTTAGATTAAVLINKSTPPRFELNRPFQYMIVEKTTNLILFAGQVRNPKTT